jgi:hypothetical protein
MDVSKLPFKMKPTKDKLKDEIKNRIVLLEDKMQEALKEPRAKR